MTVSVFLGSSHERLGAGSGWCMRRDEGRRDSWLTEPTVCLAGPQEVVVGAKLVSFPAKTSSLPSSCWYSPYFLISGIHSFTKSLKGQDS